MEYKEAVAILLELLKNPSLSGKEREAILTALGVLDMASLGETRMKSIINAKKSKIAKSLIWKRR
jgi:hypothetical protein